MCAQWISSPLIKAVAAFVFAVGACAHCERVNGQTIDIISVDLSGLPQGTPLATAIGIRNTMYEAERELETRLIGFSARLPAIVQRSVHAVRFTITIEGIDGPGGVLAFAGATSFLQLAGSKPYALPQSAIAVFDSEDAVILYQLGLLKDTAMHEFCHGLGFSGNVWGQNRLNLGPFNGFTGSYGLKAFRKEAKKPAALYVPVEQAGGAGTAGSHWDSAESFFYDPATNRGELMIGFLTDSAFISETTWASFADSWYKVKGVNDTLVGSRPGNGTGRGPRTIPAQ
jgi:hypothetical protein